MHRFPPVARPHRLAALLFCAALSFFPVLLAAALAARGAWGVEPPSVTSFGEFAPNDGTALQFQTNRLQVGAALDDTLTEYLLNVARGKVVGATPFWLQGYRKGLDNGNWTDIWGGTAELRPGFTEGQQIVEVVSSSANDTAEGTGARTVVVVGVGADGNIYETDPIELNGVTPVLVDEADIFQAIHRVFVASVGSGGKNAGVISVLGTLDDDDGDEFEAAAIGYNASLSAGYTVPTGKRLLVTRLFAYLHGTNASESPVLFKVSTGLEPLALLSVRGTNDNQGVPIELPFDIPLVIAAGETVRVQGLIGTQEDNIEVYVGLGGILEIAN